jgi:hypothetical protein
MTRNGMKIMGACALLLLLGACAAGGIESGQAAHGGALSVFLLGLWQGIIAPVTLLVEIGHKLWPHVIPWDIRMYETKAAGMLYDLGFYLGLGGGPVVVFRRW